MKWKISISVLWLVFAVLFFVLAGLHFAESKHVIEEFKVTPLGSSGTGIAISGTNIKEPLEDFARDFNNYLADQNKSNHKINLYACYGYLLAGATAFVSMVLVWQEYIFAMMMKRKRC
ncbi:MAG: hypothetical protein WAK60_11865 [Sedimentisphaerales bacterium]